MCQPPHKEVTGTDPPCASGAALGPLFSDVGRNGLNCSEGRGSARGNADLGGKGGIAQNAGRLVVVARRGAHVDAQQDLAPPVEHIPEEMRHLKPAIVCGGGCVMSKNIRTPHTHTLLTEQQNEEVR